MAQIGSNDTNDSEHKGGGVDPAKVEPTKAPSRSNIANKFQFGTAHRSASQSVTLRHFLIQPQIKASPYFSHYIKLLDKEVRGIPAALRGAIPLLAPTAILFHAFIIFDTVGEASGLNAGILTSLVMIAICVSAIILMHYGELCFQRKDNKRVRRGIHRTSYAIDLEAGTYVVTGAETEVDIDSARRSGDTDVHNYNLAGTELSATDQAEQVEEEEGGSMNADSSSTNSRSKRSTSSHFTHAAKLKLNRVYIEPCPDSDLPLASSSLPLQDC
jgi:hypothetical protein